MTIHEQISEYAVSTLRNDVVDYRRIIRLTTQSGTQLFLAFTEDPPDNWLDLVDGGATVYLPAGDFDDTYRVLRSENPTFVTALDLFGLRAFSIDSGAEAPGHGAIDPQELVALMGRAD